MRIFLIVFTCLSSLFSMAQPPNAQFTANPLSVCVGQPISFTNQSTAGGSPITSYTWNFGNGETSTFQNTTYVYNTPGVYTVTLAVQAANGQADAEVKTGYITVNPLPTASFTTSGNGCTVPFGVTFTNTSTTGPGMTYNWNFGNGQNSTLQNPSQVTYNTAGTYNVTLTVANPNTGCSATTTQSIVVSNYTAGITAPATACKGAPVTFHDNSTVGANSWSWNAGPAGTSSQEDPVFTFNTPGNYAVTLTSQNTASGCSNSTVHNITILPAPTPNFTATPTTGCSPLPVSFTNTSGAGTTFKWTFGDGTTFTGPNPPTHTYSGNGSYSVSLVMTGTNGCKDSITKPNLITLSDPVVQFTATPHNGCSPLPVQFSQSSISPDPVNDPIVNWQWNFGDGTTFTGQTPPVHSYGVGVYDVTLTITTQSGCSATLTQNDTIKVGHIDQVSFTVAPQIQCAKNDVHFTNTSVISAPHTPNEVTYSWNFGDNQNSTQQNPNHSYEQDTGYFNVSLIVDFRGCKDTLIMPQAVYIKAPISRFTPASTLYCNPASFPVNVAVTDNSIIGKLSDDAEMIWRWGDGTTTHFDDPDFDDADLGSTSHNYTNYGTYTIKQVIYNHTTGCSDSTTTIIHISRTIASFTVANDSVCKNSPLGLNGTATTSTHPMGTWSYAMGNGQTANGSQTSYVYTQAGTYTITLTATNNVGCSGTTTFTPVQVLELPLAQLTANDNAGCSPFTVNFTNGSVVQGNGMPLQSFLWSFADDNSTQTTTSVGQSVNHTFNTEGNFNVTLIATDVFGCVSSPASTQISITKPVATFAVDSILCDLEIFTTTNGSTGFGPLSYQWFIDGVPNSTDPDIASLFDETPSPNSTHVNHLLTLITTDGNGCKDTATVHMVVSMPVAGINFQLDGASVNGNGQYTCPPVFADFQDASDTYGNIVSWNWDFGDNANTSANQDPSNTYVFPGTYSTTLTIVDEYGCSSDTTLVNYLTIFGPTGTPSWTQSAFACGQYVTFTLTDTSSVSNIVWNTDDGSFTNDSLHFVHNYTSINTFNPTVTLTDANGCSVIYPMNPITILSNGLDALFVPNADVIKLGGQAIFDDQSTFTNTPIVSWVWTFGDGTGQNNSTGADAIHSYSKSGYQTVTLVVTDANGCKDNYTVKIFIDADFDMPNVFTPNGDGANDHFAIFADIFNSFDILIVNRWGNVVQNKTNLTGIDLWDGTDNGDAPCTDGVYFYRFSGTLNDGVTKLNKAGYVTLIGSKE